ncbi:26S proteasome non-ATPase regulatory subunit 9 [Plasmodium brasilianum]|uniref:26S proteasome non-ATPase regulatory subunit 9, putative n=2 Tax=Plasmodium (Plasmodium) TaxID=418103 RepID=A0A1A8WT78_PLAMA|nr:26S proteasome non-ATPase regulatory subunit 9, putative [Plasmodium malariae]KAI4838913.1 26S proteasome non-ATPase regulatory subunit 9 [Plasmodium brasilianum]SBS96160.1 proteasome regulatory protein, putative [Plasmodium malariae]SCN12258.1 26S proteasome non-ATPase regulatory subunit 9, putative [Plasmodium malariae]
MDLKEFHELAKRREDIEREIKENMEFLEKPENKNIGMDGKLIDSEGFPRNDIDIYRIRIARNKIICLRNDYIDINKKIEEYLHNIHNSHPVIRVERNRNVQYDEQDINGNIINEPRISQDQIEEAKNNIFAMIDEIIENSPAHKAGLRVNDYIFEFGDVKRKSEKEDNKNVDIFKKITDYVKNNPSKIEVKILREEKVFFYYIFPDKTANGLYIGCHLTPTKNVAMFKR